MARTKNEIKTEITSRFMANETLTTAYGFNTGADFSEEFSLVSLENIIFEIVAYALFLHEQIFDQHQKEINSGLAELKPHTSRWYRNKALYFRYGYDLIMDSDHYNDTELTTEQIESAQIVKYAAVVEAQDDSRVIVKIATELNGQLQPITTVQKEAFEAYITEIKDAGVNITVINYLPDILRLNLRIFRDPLVLDASGTDRVNGRRPVESALQEYMKELPFNGELIIQELANKLEAVPGVKIVQVDEVLTKWIDADSDTYGNFENVDVRQIPVSGYFELENFNGVSYVV